MLDTLLPPRKVLASASLLGAHADCVAAGYEGSCLDCQKIFHTAMDSRYGHLSTLSEVLDELFSDWERDAS